MWTGSWLRVLSASLILKPLAEASSGRSVRFANSSTATGVLSSQELAASGTRASVVVWTSEEAVYTSAHQSTRLPTSRWHSAGDAPTDSWIGRASSGVAAVCSDGRPCSLSTVVEPMAAASPPASPSESATPSPSTNGRAGIFTETATQVEGAAAASVSPGLSITPADPSITPFREPSHLLFPLSYPSPAQPPLISSGPYSAPPISPVTPGRPRSTRSVLSSSLFPSVHSSSVAVVLASASSPRISLSPTHPVDHSPPHTPAPLPIASTATPSPFASASVVKSAAEATSAHGSKFSASLTTFPTFSSLPHASPVSPSVPGDGVATPCTNSSVSFQHSNTTLAVATTIVISRSMALPFYTSFPGAPSFPTVFTSGASQTASALNPPAPTLLSTMSDNTILPTSTSEAFAPDSSSIFVCGGNPFKPSEYTCYDESTLCPVENGVRLEACGGSCFNPGSYSCIDNGLQPIISGTLPGGVTPSRTMAVPVTQWPSGVSTPLVSAASTASSQASTITSSASTFSTSITSSSSSSASSSSTSASSSSSSSSTSSSSSSSSSTTSATTISSSTSSSSSPTASASSSASSTASPPASNNDNNLSTDQIAAIAASTSAAVVLFVLAGILLFRRHQRKRATSTQQVYPELAYLYDPPVPGSGNGSRSVLEGPSANPSGGGGAVGPFGVGGPGGVQSTGVSGGAGAAGAGNATGWTGATLSALGASLRGGGRSTSPHSSSSNGSAVSLVGPAGRPPIMGTPGASGSNGSGSGSSNAALLAASSGKSGSGTPTHGAGDGSTVAPASGTDVATGDELRPFLGAAATTESSGESSRDRSGERGAPASQEQVSGREGPGLWDEIDREAAERAHERQVEETRQRRELARAFLLQAKERQEQRIPLLSRGGGEASSVGAGAAAGVGGAALAGAAVAAGSRSQQRQGNPKAQHTQQWWQSSPPGSPPPGSPSPPTAAHANTAAYQPIYPPISPTYPVSGPILTSQHIEQNRLQQAQHARATSRATSSTYPSFDRPRPSYPSPSWSQAQQNTYNQLNNGDSASAYNSSKGYASGGYSFSGRPFFHQNTSYNPPHRSYSNYSQPSGINNGTYSYGGSSYSQYSMSSYGGHRRGSSDSVHNSNAAGGVYTTIPEEDPPHQPQQQSLHQIMHQMNSLDEEDSADEGQGFLKVPRRVLSVRNGAVTPSSDGDESTDERDGGGRRPRMI